MQNDDASLYGAALVTGAVNSWGLDTGIAVWSEA